MEIDLPRVVLAIVATLSLIINFILFLRGWSDRSLLKKQEVMRLHEFWWSEDMWRYRRKFGLLQKEWKESQKRVIPDKALDMDVTLDESGTDIDHVRIIGRIAIFYCDLKVMIDNDLICSKTAYALFGESQYYRMLDFFQAIIKARSNEDRKTPRWIEEIESLDSEFSKYRK